MALKWMPLADGAHANLGCTDLSDVSVKDSGALCTIVMDHRHVHDYKCTS